MKSESANTQQRPRDPEIAVTSEGVAFTITDYELDVAMEALKEYRDSIGDQMDETRDKDDPDDWAAMCERFLFFHRVLCDLKKRRGKQ